MERWQQDRVVTGQGDDDRAEAERLLELCNRDEGLDLPIAIDPALAGGDEATQFRAYNGGALVGFAWLPPDADPEACLMVHPAHRRRGLGRTLLAAVRAEAGRRGLSQFLLVCDEASPSGMAFATAVGGQRGGGEYRLTLDPAAVNRTRPRIGGLELRPGGGEDAATLTQVLAEAFGIPEKEAWEGLAGMLAQPERRHFLAMLGGEPIGLLRLGANEAYADITAFGVLPAYQHRGYGRQMLLDAVDLLLAEGRTRVLIEVAADNDRALGLYQSCGFRVTSAYGFYALTA